eukprot:2462273-Alexandrium_andersonii.AAC.1
MTNDAYLRWDVSARRTARAACIAEPSVARNIHPEAEVAHAGAAPAEDGAANAVSHERGLRNSSLQFR